MSANLYALFQSRFPEDRGRAFLTAPGGPSLDYRALASRTAQFASTLRGLGASVGDRVVVQVEKSPETVLLYLGCLRAGVVFIPLNPAYSQEEVGYFLTDSRPALFVCEPGREAWAVDGVPARALRGPGGLASEAEFEEPSGEVVAREASDTAAILYTSGTTGRSKGAVLTHGNLAANALALHRAWGFAADDTLLHILPVYHAHGLFVALHTTLLNGTGMLFLERFEVDRVCDLLPEATVLMGVPTHYVRLLSEPRFDAGVCRNVRLFVSGSAPLREDTFERFRERTGHTILERYGMTETGMNTSNPLQGERVAGSVGPPLEGVEVRVQDEHGRGVAQGDVGSLEVRGGNVFQEYWGQPEKTAASFRPEGWFVTGDLARVDARGYVHLVGRDKELIITGGLNVYPREVERVLDAIPGVLESAVFGLEDAEWGEAVCAAIVREPGSVVPAAEEVADAARAHLASFKLPRRVFVVPALPRNAMGKVEKARLRADLGG
jgi:malonyl-CoA/methylmalonyl-CoA synthetase